ncbi:hypothetical protein LSTR_LSTR013100 [Laodelphax striatellus]|uniref:Uncharacterized protein n=1 Tax=Laodelphax striatellus TaxID=195883 RepID=A0A482XK31_LAOST|nr:hypothetical protein LSTR_LSTR013100 [Laodelphax striatellus]
MGSWIHLVSLALVMMVLVEAGDMMRKSIVFDKKTPGVFYCPQRKPTGFDKMIVHARPLSKLCEHDGKKLPPDYKSDCYHDVDETEYACKEKYRIMVRMHPPGGEDDKESQKWVKGYERYLKKRKADDHPVEIQKSQRLSETPQKSPQKTSETPQKIPQRTSETPQKSVPSRKPQKETRNQQKNTRSSGEPRKFTRSQETLKTPPHTTPSLRNTRFQQLQRNLRNLRNSSRFSRNSKKD